MPTSSMPQPWPAVSPDQAKRTVRAVEAGAVRKRPTIGSETRLMSVEIGRGQAVKDVLVGRQILDQPHLTAKSLPGSASSGDEREPASAKALGRRNTRPSPAPGGRPASRSCRRLGVDIARLHAVREDRPRGGLAERRQREGRCREAGGDEAAGGKGDGRQAQSAGPPVWQLGLVRARGWRRGCSRSDDEA